jgi:hypothetical protein
MHGTMNLKFNLKIFGEDANYALCRYVLSLKPLSNSRRRNHGGWPAIITSLAVGMATMKIKKIREYVRSEVCRGRLGRLLSSGVLRHAAWEIYQAARRSIPEASNLHRENITICIITIFQ